MALKNMIKVGDKVLFGRAGEGKRLGTIVKMNAKTARIKVPRDGEFNVTYNLIQLPSRKDKKSRATPQTAAGSGFPQIGDVVGWTVGRARNLDEPAPVRFGRVLNVGRDTVLVEVTKRGHSDWMPIRKIFRGSEANLRNQSAEENPSKVAATYHEGATSYKVGSNVSKARAAAKKAEAAAKQARAAAKKAEVAAKKAPAKRPRQKATGRKICAVPVAKRQCAPKKPKKTPPSRKSTIGLKPHFTRKKGLSLEERVRRDVTVQLGTPGNYQYELSATDQKKYRDAFTAAALSGDKPFAAMKKAKEALSPSAVALAFEKAERTRRRYDREYADPVENPYVYGQELEKQQRRSRQKEDWPSETVAFATTAPDYFTQEETGRWAREQTRQNPSSGFKAGDPVAFSQAGKQYYGKILKIAYYGAGTSALVKTPIGRLDVPIRMLRSRAAN